MKRSVFLLSMLSLLMLAHDAAAQTGAVIYSLPRTTVRIQVKARREAFTAGPYAQFAQKYMGVAARTGNSTSVTLEEITLEPFVEADPSIRYTASIPEKSSANFLQFCTQGLIAMADNYTGQPVAWRFTPQAGTASFEGIDPLGNLGKETTTLYKAVRTDEGYESVPVSQDNVIEKSPDRKAADAAAAIFSLREKRQQIATGDTDATFSGEALQAAIDEIDRLEARYLSLFYGIRDISFEEKTFEITPEPGSSQRYTVFRIGDNLAPASAASGRAVTLELKAESTPRESASDTRAKEGSVIHYRIPAIMQCRLTDGNNLLLESRIPVYQLGDEVTFPINVLLTK